jgi:hypothetical protein
MTILTETLRNIDLYISLGKTAEAYITLLSIRCHEIDNIQDIERIILKINSLINLNKKEIDFLRLYKNWMLCLFEKAENYETDPDDKIEFALYQLAQVYKTPFNLNLYYNLMLSSTNPASNISHYYSKLWPFRVQWIESSEPIPPHNKMIKWLQSENHQLVSWALDALESHCSAEQFSDIIQLFIEVQYYHSKDLYAIRTEKLKFTNLNLNSNPHFYKFLTNKTDRLIEKYIFNFPDTAITKINEFILDAPYASYLLRHFLHTAQEKYLIYIDRVINYIIDEYPNKKHIPSPLDRKIGMTKKKSYYSILSEFFDSLFDSSRIFSLSYEELTFIITSISIRISHKSIYINDEFLIESLQSPNPEIRHAAKFLIAFLPVWAKNILPEQIFDLFSIDNEPIFDDLIWLCLAKSANFSSFSNILKIKYSRRHWIQIIPKEYALNNKEKMWEILTDVRKYTLMEPKTNYLIRSPYDWEESEASYFGDNNYADLFSQIKRSIKKTVSPALSLFRKRRIKE